jgi:hypothetical protein
LAGMTQVVRRWQMEREIQSIWDFPWWVWGTTSWPNETETTIKVESSSPKLGEISVLSFGRSSLSNSVRRFPFRRAAR